MEGGAETDGECGVTPMPPEIVKTITAYRRIVGKVQLLLHRQGIKLAPLAALSLALLPPERITVGQARRQRLVLGANPYNTVETLHQAGLVRCAGGDKSCGRLSVELTPSGARLAEAVRLALGGQDAAMLEAAE
jgi:hypothetical protein